MRILVFSDIHGDAAALNRLMDTEADIYISAGDLCTWSRGLDQMGEILARRAGQVWALPGNHEDDKQIEALCTRFGLNPLHGRSFEAAGHHIAGLGYSNPTPFNTPGEYSESEIALRLEPFASLTPLVLVCHCPPRGTPLDEASPGAHLGSVSVGEFIHRVQPIHFVCGHIHEAAGRTVQLGGTRASNAGKAGIVVNL
jgi:uncharacterized protein